MRLRSCSNGRKEINNAKINNELETAHGLKEKHRSDNDSREIVHVDDISELCLDVLVNSGDQESDANTQRILKDAIDRFNQRVRPLYN